jgi:serine/threonine-protein kinase
MSDIPERLAAALRDRYLIEREIGAGGMANVYLARDLRHKRLVALKVVRPELKGREGVDRFLREIELAARLQHPHILPVFDSGVIDESTGTPIPYFVMPYVEGETLRQLLQRGGRLPVDAATTIAVEVADALGYAHAKGVVHRDIKPENILLSGGHAVVADFGVAKALERATTPGTPDPSTRITRAGMVMGTPHYMSPEQATGDQAVDARSDQYSLACVLYEMLAGEPPFAGPTAQTIIAKSLTAPRPHVGRTRAGVSPALDEVVHRALALEPAGRYLDMAAMKEALQATGAPGRPGVRRRILLAGGLAALAVAGGWWLTQARRESAVVPGAETLAVLPFHTSGPGVEFLGEGMVDLLATNLRGVGGINTVDPRAVLRKWGGEGQGPNDLGHALSVGRRLNAGSVVLGSAVSTGGRVRLAADLYGISGERLGRAQVDASADSVLGAVDRLSVALLRDVWRSKEPLPNLRLASLTTDSIDALRSYLDGERYYRRLHWDSALSAYTRAVETDSTFALAHLRRAQVFGWTGGYGNRESRQAVAAAVRFASRLPERDRRLLAGHRLFEQGKPASIDSLRAFLAAYPEDVEGWYLLGESMYHTYAFRPSEPESVAAVFDSVLRRDSTLFPALIHPMELAIIYRDTTRFARYFPMIERTAPAAQVSALRTTAGLVWGPEPTDSALRSALARQASWIIQAIHSTYRQPGFTSDSVVRLFARAQRVGSKEPLFVARGLAARSQMLAGMGRWREAGVLVDSLRSFDPDKATEVVAWAIALGLAPPSATGFLDTAATAFPDGPEAEYARGMVHLVRGEVAEGRRRMARALAAADSARLPPEDRGLMLGADGWGALLQGDSTEGLRRLRAGLEQAAAPGRVEESAFLRLQLALALASRPETREEGIRWLRHAFQLQPLYTPLAYLALGRTYEAAGQRDLAMGAYSRFLRFWDRADPELRGRGEEAREALAELSAEQGR